MARYLKEIFKHFLHQSHQAVKQTLKEARGGGG
jgi:hypothetical protein